MKNKNLLFTAIAILGLTTISMAQVPSYVPTNGLVGYWPFNGNANDESGNGNNGIVNGAIATVDRFGNVNQAFNFDGVNDYIEVANNANLNPTSITLSGWINSFENASNVQSDAKAIITKWYQQVSCGSASDNYNLQLTYINDTSVLVGATTPNNQALNSISSITNVVGVNTWHHFAFIHDNLNGQKLFVDGVQINDNNISGDLCSSTNNLLFGADNFLGTNLWRFFKGKLDDIGIWNRALNPQEITALYTTTPLSINQFLNESFSIYPNPAKNQSNIKADAKFIGSDYTIYDRTGKSVLRGKIKAENTIIELDNLLSGIYLISVGDNLKQTFKIVKE
jgi:hypothetical protein